MLDLRWSGRQVPRPLDFRTEHNQKQDYLPQCRWNWQRQGVNYYWACDLRLRRRQQQEHSRSLLWLGLAGTRQVSAAFFRTLAKQASSLTERRIRKQPHKNWWCLKFADRLEKQDCKDLLTWQRERDQILDNSSNQAAHRLPRRGAHAIGMLAPNLPHLTQASKLCMWLQKQSSRALVEGLNSQGRPVQRSSDLLP
jgi:hypothetical protein